MITALPEITSDITGLLSNFTTSDQVKTAKVQAAYCKDVPSETEGMP